MSSYPNPSFSPSMMFLSLVRKEYNKDTQFRSEHHSRYPLHFGHLCVRLHREMKLLDDRYMSN